MYNWVDSWADKNINKRVFQSTFNTLKRPQNAQKNTIEGVLFPFYFKECKYKILINKRLNGINIKMVWLMCTKNQACKTNY
ncbi:MAG: hypothetical protein CVU03_03415 [Bacteroidetes bacterium HGW-Bacteroidetes-2]|nr:MAG: hypothetical protein CVU03_03415 [Bacteroidetes bacterium HGW-Bacteroidetes-2]